MNSLFVLLAVAWSPANPAPAAPAAAPLVNVEVFPADVQLHKIGRAHV